MSKKNQKPKAKKQVNPFDRLNKQIVDQKQFGDYKQTTVKFTAKNGKNDIDKHEVEAMMKAITGVGDLRGKEIKTVVRGMNCQRMFTLKPLDGPLQIKEFEDYYDGKVKNENKFEMFSEIDITILVYGKPEYKQVFKK